MVALTAGWVARVRGSVRVAFPVLPARLSEALAAEARGLVPWLPVAFGGGVLGYLALRAEPPGWAGVAAAAGALAVLALAWRHGLARGFAMLALAGALGFAGVQAHSRAAPPVLPLPTRAVVLEARVVVVEALAQGARLTLAGATWEGQTDPLPRTLRVRLRAGDPASADPTRVTPGDRVRIRALLRPPSAPAEPGAFDFQRAAFFAGSAGTGFALGPVEVVARGNAGPAAPATWFAALRAEVVARTRAAVPGPEGAIAAALLAGSQAGIGPVEAQAMRDSGLSHLLSVSGLHITIVIGTLFVVLRLLFALWPWLVLTLPAKAIAMVIGLAGGGFYTLLTGAEVPMLRSFLMAALVVAAVLAGRRAISLRVLALVALAVLAIRPEAVVSASFQMSFAAVAALVAGFQALRTRLPLWLEGAGPLRPAALAVAGLVATSVLAGVATAPYALYHFQRASLYGVAANALAVPLTSFFIMPAGMVAMLLMPLGLEWIALKPMGFGCWLVLEIARIVAAWPGAAPAFPAMPAWGLLAATFGLLLLCLLRTRLRLLGAPLLLLGFASPAWHRAPDLLVSADARLIAVNQGGVLHLSRFGGASLFAAETWQRRAGTPPIAPLACAAPWCRIGDVAIVPRGAAPPGLCGSVPVVVGHEPLRGRCRGSLAIDRFDVWRDGPHAVWLTAAGPVAVSDRAARGDRPWVPPRPRPRASDPPAASE